MAMDVPWPRAAYPTYPLYRSVGQNRYDHASRDRSSPNGVVFHPVHHSAHTLFETFFSSAKFKELYTFVGK